MQRTGKMKRENGKEKIGPPFWIAAHFPFSLFYFQTLIRTSCDFSEFFFSTRM